MSLRFVHTTVTGDDSLNELFVSAKAAPFVSYDDEFLSVISPNPRLNLIGELNETELFFYESGVWFYDRNEVWFTSALEVGGPTQFRVLNLANNTISIPPTSGPVNNPDGGYYYNGTIFFTTFQSPAYPGGIVSVDPITGEVSTVVTSYFGLRLSSPDDLTWVLRDGNSYMFFSDLYYDYLAFPADPDSVLSGAVWRFDPHNGTLLPMIGRGDILNLNGIRVNKEMIKFYIGETSYTASLGGGVKSWAQPAVWVYDLDGDVRSVNKRLFSLARTGGPDGMRIDDSRRVWLGEGEGIVVRNEWGKPLGWSTRRRC